MGAPMGNKNAAGGHKKGPYAGSLSHNKRVLERGLRFGRNKKSKSITRTKGGYAWKKGALKSNVSKSSIRKSWQ